MWTRFLTTRRSRARLAGPAGVLALLALAGLSTACGDEGGGDDVTVGDGAQITYHFGDASVPPQYHRSYTLTVDASSVHAVIDSYGDVVEDVTVDLPPEVWDGLVADAGAVAGLDAADDDDGCSGGTSRSIAITEGGETVLDQGFSVCGGVNGGQADALDAYIRPVLDAIPDWDDLVAT